MAFALSLALVITINLLYLYNLIHWRNYPDFGFGWRTATGVDYVGQLTENGRKAGMQLGDRFLEVNGEKFSTIQQFRALMRRDLGEENTYLLEREGRTFAVTVKNVPSGFARVFKISGFFFVLGFCYALIGTLVFLMKPHRRASWIFFLYASIFGMLLTFFRQLSTLSPSWLENLIIFAYCFTPTVFIHLAFSFPEERGLLKKHPYIQLVPYLISAVLFVLIRKATPVMASAPKSLTIVAVAYMAIGVLFFLISNFQLRIASSSEIVKLRARMILLGFAIAASLPLTDFVINALFKVYLVEGVNYYLPFLIAVPSFIGYSIVKHDLFDIDTIIKRTYGYVLTTASLGGIYGVFVLISNVAFGRYEITKSPIFPLAFILAVVFFFNPIRNRVQRFINRVFYRLEYDYQETVGKISETMRSLLNLDQICKSIMRFALEPMFIDSGSVMILSKDKDEYECFIQTDERPGQKSANDAAVKATLKEKSAVFDDEIAKGGQVPREGVEAARQASDLILPLNDPLMRKIAELKKEVTLYDIQEDPLFEDKRKACEQAFKRLGATLIVPLIYENRLSGVISLGRKKSGKFYRREDINLLNTLAGQAALAVENARMVEEIVEKERMRAKILDAFGKYVTPEVRDQILEGNIPLDGEAKEVTVLFADLRDFTTMAESTTPKEVVRIINGYFSEMADAIGQNRGLVLQFIGDEIEAVFGAPLPLDDHPTHAVRAALAMQQRLVVVNEKLKQQGYGPLRHGIGIHTGTVVAANIGSEDRLSYAMVGDTVNLASRIQSLNKEFGTDLLISATTVERLVDDIAIEKLPATTVKGKRNPVEVYKLDQTP
jgi:class 3 adenylate cyclase